MSSKSWYPRGPLPIPACLTFVVEVINVVRTGYSHHLTWCPQRPAQDVVPLRQAGAPCTQRDRQSGDTSQVHSVTGEMNAPVVTASLSNSCIPALENSGLVFQRDYIGPSLPAVPCTHLASQNSLQPMYWHWPWAGRGQERGMICSGHIAQGPALKCSASGQASLSCLCSWSHLPGVPVEGQVSRLIPSAENDSLPGDHGQEAHLISSDARLPKIC